MERKKIRQKNRLANLISALTFLPSIFLPVHFFLQNLSSLFPDIYLAEFSKDPYGFFRLATWRVTP